MKLDPSSHTPAGLAPGIDRLEAEARQDRWMAELERAAFSATTRRQPERGLAEQPRGRSAPPAIPGTTLQPHPARPDAIVAGGDGPAAPLASRPGAAAAAVQSEERPSQGRQAGADRAATPSPAVKPGDAASERAPSSPSLQAGAVMPMPVQPNEAAGKSAAVAAPPASAATPVGYAALGALARITNGNGAGAAPAAAAVLPALADTPYFALAPGAADSGAAPQAAAQDEEAAPAAGAKARQAEPFAKSLLHLVHGEDGVQAFIRDATLGGAQAQAVAAAMAREFALSGTALAALSVNGKALRQGDPGARDDDDGAAGAFEFEPSQKPARPAGGLPLPPGDA